MGETSGTIWACVQTARNIQQLRFTNYKSDIICNADMRVGEIRQFCELQDEGQSLMRAAMSQMNLSARAAVLSKDYDGVNSEFFAIHNQLKYFQHFAKYERNGLIR